jgi:hypothetical protein
MKKLITAGLALGLFGTVAHAQNQQAATIDAVEQMKAATQVTSQWIGIRANIAKVGSQWHIDRQLMQQRIDLYRSEIDQLQRNIAEMTSKAAEGQGKRAELSNEIDTLERAQKVVVGILPRYEAQLRELAKYFPEPLLRTTSRMIDSIPTSAANVRLGAGQRLALIVSVLNEVDKFNRDVTTSQELRQISGESRQVSVMYMGLGQAFYADATGSFGGVGFPAKGGWVWEERNDMAAQIRDAIKVAQGEIKPAIFVELPLQVTQIKVSR